MGFIFNDCHTLTDSTNGRVTDSKIVRLHAFLVRSPYGECVPCQVISVCPVLSVGKFWTCSKLRTDATG